MGTILNNTAGTIPWVSSTYSVANGSSSITSWQEWYAMRDAKAGDVLMISRIAAPPEVACPNLAWLDRRIDEMRVKL